MAKLVEHITQPRVAPAALPGVILIAISGLGIFLYGLATLLITPNYWIEIGLGPAQTGGTAEQIEQLSPRLFDYITHIQVASCGLLMAFGLITVCLAWFGVRTGQKWALWAAFGGQALTFTIGLPLHFVYGIVTLGHLGPVFVDMAFITVGTVLAYKALY